MNKSMQTFAIWRTFGSVLFQCYSIYVAGQSIDPLLAFHDSVCRRICLLLFCFGAHCLIRKISAGEATGADDIGKLMEKWQACSRITR